MEYGIKYKEIPLVNNSIDVDKVLDSIGENTKLLLIQDQQVIVTEGL